MNLAQLGGSDVHRLHQLRFRRFTLPLLFTPVFDFKIQSADA